MRTPVTEPAGPGLVAEIRFTDRDDGDFDISKDPETLDRVRRSVIDTDWNWLEQVHDDVVIEVQAPGECRGAAADALLTRTAGVAVAVQSADCAPVVLVAPGVAAVVHAGWRGLMAGVVARTVEKLAVAPSTVKAHLGPVIRSSDYEFGEAELIRVAGEFGPEVRGVTTWDSPALDLPAAVEVALKRAGVDQLVDHGHDTAEGHFFSHRLRAETGRQSTVAWLREVAA